MIRSLRARLLLGLVTLVVLGLVVSDVVTCWALQSLLTRRVDDQLDTGSRAVAGYLVSQRDGRPYGPGGPGRGEPVFEAFYRADPGRSRDRGGSGLGLSIVAAVVAAHGGRVLAEGTAGGGATFRVELPA